MVVAITTVVVAASTGAGSSAPAGPAAAAASAVRGTPLTEVPRADFDGDGFADLALGVPREYVEGIAEAGVVHVIFGSDAGLTAEGNQLLHQDAGRYPGRGEAGDLIGFSLVADDFDADGYADLAVGAPFEDAPGLVNAGVLTVLYGSPAGLTSERAQRFDEDTAEVSGTVDAGDLAGFSLAAGDVDGDGFADLAAGIPRDDVEGIGRAGVVMLLHGSASGLVVREDVLWTQATAGVPDAPEQGDRFGDALIAGDIDGDGYDDVVIGAPSEDLAAGGDEGIVTVLHGSPAGLTTAGAVTFTQDDAGMGDAAEAGDGLGRPLVTGDVTGDGIDDLVIGVFGEDVSGQADAGAAQLLLGSSSGLAPAARSLWHQDVQGVPGVAGRQDFFAEALALGDLNGDELADLAVGDHHDAEAGPVDAGAVNVFYATTEGLSTDGAQQWTEDSPGVPDVAEDEDHFGSVVAIGHFGSGIARLVIGVHTETIEGLTSAGAVTVMNGSAEGVTSAGAQYWTQDSPGIRERVDRLDYFPYALAATG